MRREAWSRVLSPAVFAKALVGLAFVLILLGTLVTTLRVGMADPVWPTVPWHLALIDWTEPKPGFILEHSHRLAGWIVGFCSIALVLTCWLGRPLTPTLSQWERGVAGAPGSAGTNCLPWAVVAMIGIGLQGILGGFRVRLDVWLGADLAMIHGAFAQVVFALIVTVALLTSRAWARHVGAEGPSAVRFRRWGLVVVGVIYLQIVMGAYLRHTYSTLGQRGHLIVAFAVVGAVAWWIRSSYDLPQRGRSLAFALALLGGLTAFQVLVGVETWILRFLAHASLTGQVFVKTTHVMLGFLIFATAVAGTLLAHKRQAVERAA